MGWWLAVLDGDILLFLEVSCPGPSAHFRDDGRVYGCGSNGYGQLGEGSETRWGGALKELSSVSGIVAIACGGNHSLLLDSTKHIKLKT
jgi:alpha-tubulin suppressor-like RCC1 family protein